MPGGPVVYVLHIMSTIARESSGPHTGEGVGSGVSGRWRTIQRFKPPWSRRRSRSPRSRHRRYLPGPETGVGGPPAPPHHPAASGYPLNPDTTSDNVHYVNFCLAFSPGQFFALGPWLVHYFFMSPFPTFLDGPYRPKAQPRSGIFHPLTKVDAGEEGDVS